MIRGTIVPRAEKIGSDEKERKMNEFDKLRLEFDTLEGALDLLGPDDVPDLQEEIKARLDEIALAITKEPTA